MSFRLSTCTYCVGEFQIRWIKFTWWSTNWNSEIHCVTCCGVAYTVYLTQLSYVELFVSMCFITKIPLYWLNIFLRMHFRDAALAWDLDLHNRLPACLQKVNFRTFHDLPLLLFALIVVVLSNAYWRECCVQIWIQQLSSTYVRRLLSSSTCLQCTEWPFIIFFTCIFYLPSGYLSSLFCIILFVGMFITCNYVRKDFPWLFDVT